MLHYYDDDDETRRDWERIAPDGISRVTISDKLMKFRSGGKVIRQGLLIAHRSTVIATCGFEVLSRIAACEQSMYFVVVSGKRQREAHSTPNNLYYRHWPVGNPLDNGFINCWKRFYREFLQGRTRFNLLEPVHTPHLSALRILVAAHLFTPDRRTGHRANTPSVALIKTCERVLGAKDSNDLTLKLAGEVPDADAADLVSLLSQNNLVDLSNRLDSFLKELPVGRGTGNA